MVHSQRLVRESREVEGEDEMKVKELIVYKNITYKPNSDRMESEEIDLEGTVFKILRYLAVKEYNESKKWYQFWK